MNAKLAAAVIAIAILPLAVISWLGVRTLENERELIEHRLDEVIAARLQDVSRIVQRVLTRRETELRQLLDRPALDTDALRRIARDTPLLSQTFRLNNKGQLIHPPPIDRNEGESRFIERTRELWQSKEPFYHPGDGHKGPLFGWHTWYLGGGINLLFWQQSTAGGIVGAELSRLALVAEIIGELPTTDANGSGFTDGRVVLKNGSGLPLYSFGQHIPAAAQSPRQTFSLRPPLGAWRLDYFHTPSSSSGSKSRPGWFLWLGGGGLVLIVGVLVLIVLTEHKRERRIAMQRVTFVNQVSHELKTPLTSIRMYAELLEGEFDDDNPKGSKYLQIIVAESRRLSRLIGNVLSFAKKQRLRCKEALVDHEIERVLEYHRPRFGQLGMELVFDGAAASKCRLDTDVLGQIVGNLLTNAEKYAVKEGTQVTVKSRIEKEGIVVTVSDEGPGIPKWLREKVFRPFFRASSDVTEGVSGTGIGLSISRDLAQLHGGELRILDSNRGARFELTIRTDIG